MSRVTALSLLLLGVVTGASAQPITFSRFDVNHSTIGFAVPILGGMSEVTGKFTDFALTLVYDEQDITKSSVEAVIQTASVNTGIPDRDNHLRTADFFDAAKYPEIRFSSSRIEKRGSHLLAIGDLQMRGVSKRIELPFEVKGLDVEPQSGKVTLAVATALTLNRQDYGIAWRHQSPLFVGDQIRVDIHLISRLTDRPQPAAPPPG